MFLLRTERISIVLLLGMPITLYMNVQFFPIDYFVFETPGVVKNLALMLLGFIIAQSH